MDPDVEPTLDELRERIEDLRQEVGFVAGGVRSTGDDALLATVEGLEQRADEMREILRRLEGLVGTAVSTGTDAGRRS